MTKDERMKEIAKASPDFGKRVGYKMCVVDELHDIKELQKENEELREVHESDKRSLRLIAKKGADLEKKISVLLSCKNCPDNKGGYICQKKYEGKCLAQKTQYIKELQEEIAELNGKLSNLSRVAKVRLANWQKCEKENKELKDKLEHRNCVDCSNHSSNIKLLKAKEIIRNLLRVTYGEGWNYSLDVKVKAEQFLGELK